MALRVKNSLKGLISILAIGVASVSLSGCGGNSSESPRTYGARAGEDGAKYFKESNPGLLASEESAAQYCAKMAEEGGKSNNWTVEEVFQAADSCSIWFTTEMFRK
jgi:succinate dehydrogenase/fumarate reductase flavoprotein subunit